MYKDLAYRVSVEKLADNLMRVPLYVICHFLVAFNISPLSLFDYYVSCCVPPWVILPGILHASWTWLTFFFFFHYVREVFSNYLFKHFLCSFLSSPSGTRTIWMLVHLMLFQSLLSCPHFFFFHIFFYILFWSSDLYHSFL